MRPELNENGSGLLPWQDACDHFSVLMRILLIGGNGFIGRFVMAALRQQGHMLALFHRGTTAAPDEVEEIWATGINSAPMLRS
jgi:hypothetical protein